ncbi:MAG: hypothetical protein FWC42_10100 [Proteobacteria bacterium]|nr:hypothetical protein [Pseudomonadota bacterium]
MSIADIPQTLDGARVLSVAPACPGQVGFDYETESCAPIAVSYYAIAQYAGDEPRAYLFAVSSAHRVIGDTLWESSEEAEQVALNSGKVSSCFEPIAHGRGELANIGGQAEDH